MLLRDGTTTDDRRLDRVVELDPRSRAFPIRTVTRFRPRSYTWRIPVPFVIDQGREGACVGFAVTNELMARPAEVRFSSERAQWVARHVYLEAQHVDEWEGNTYAGTSVLAGCKIAKRLGYIGEYRWAFTLEDLVRGLGHNGPAVIGIDWHESMYEPDTDGYIYPAGRVVGGHAILVRGVRIVWRSRRVSWWSRTWEDVDLDASFVTLRNSWGPGYGDRGDCRMRLSDLGALLARAGEAVFFVGRTVSP